MTDELRQIHARLVGAGYQESKATVYRSADETKCILIEEEDGQPFVQMSLKMGACVSSEALYSASDFVSIAEDLALLEQSRHRQQCAIERLLKTTAPKVLGEATIKSLAQAWYDAGFKSVQAVAPWLLEANVSVPELAAKFENAKLKPAQLARGDLGLSDAARLGHEASVGLVTPLEAIGLVRGTLTNAELLASRDREGAKS